MPIPTQEDVKRFIKANDSFFKTPLLDQTAFRQFYEDRNEIAAIADYSKRFLDVLNRTIHNEGKYNAPAAIWWQKGDFEKVLTHPEIRQFIMNNKEHPAIQAWQTEHPPINEPEPVRQTEDPPVYIPEPVRLSEDDCHKMSILITNFEGILDSAQGKLNLYLSELKNRDTPNKNTEDNIKHIENSLKVMQTLSKDLNKLKENLDNSSPPTPARTYNSLRIVQLKLVETVKNDLLNLHIEKHVKSFGEKLLNKISKFFGLSEYKSEATKSAEQKNMDISNIAQRAPDALTHASMKMKEQIEQMKQNEGAHKESENPEFNPADNTPQKFG